MSPSIVPGQAVVRRSSGVLVLGLLPPSSLSRGPTPIRRAPILAPPDDHAYAAVGFSPLPRILTAFVSSANQ